MRPMGSSTALRAVKNADEIAMITRAAKIADRALEALTAETWVGRSERELAWRLHELLHAHGADDAAFDSIVASGANGALPHAHPTDRIVETRTLVTVDWGAKVGGYYSDCTRTFSTGSPPDRLRETYDVCLAAQVHACNGIRAGMTGIEADALARDPIAEAGYGENFGHGLGHGVGLQVHEAPRLSTESTDTLESGQVVTIEPGIYLPGVGGLRIEDLAVVRDDGVELLTSLPEGADRSQLSYTRADGRGRFHQPVPQRDAHRARRADLADRRVPAREARQGRRVRADEAEVAPGRLGRRPDVPRRREVPARSHRAEEHAVPLRLGRRGRLHGRGDVRAALDAARRRRGRVAVHAAVVDRCR